MVVIHVKKSHFHYCLENAVWLLNRLALAMTAARNQHKPQSLFWTVKVRHFHPWVNVDVSGWINGRYSTRRDEMGSDGFWLAAYMLMWRTESCDWSIRYLFCEWLRLLCRCSRWRPAGSRSLRCDGPVLERWRAAWVSAPLETWWCHFLRCSRQTALVGNGEKRQLLIWYADRLETEVRGQTQDGNRSETGLNEWVIRR